MIRPRSVRRSATTAGLAAALLLTACGGDDEPVADPASTAPPVGADAAAPTDPDSTTAPAEQDTAVDGAPDATVPADLPAEYEGAIGPVELIGEPLPYLETDVVADDPAVGEPAPVVVGLDFEGNTVRIDAAEQGPTMVVFLAHWCPHCNDEIPLLNGLRDESALPADLNIVGVSTAPRADSPNFPPGEWLAEKEWQWPAIADGVDTERGSFIAAEAYGVSGFPFITLVDGDGNVVARWSGGRGAQEHLELIETHLDLS